MLPGQRDRKDNVYVRSGALVWLSWTWRDAWPEASAAVVVQDWCDTMTPCTINKWNKRSAALAVPVQFSWATSDLWLIQQNKFYWISHRSMVAQLNCTVTALAVLTIHSVARPTRETDHMAAQSAVSFRQRVVSDDQSALRLALVRYETAFDPLSTANKLRQNVIVIITVLWWQNTAGTTSDEWITNEIHNNWDRCIM